MEAVGWVGSLRGVLGVLETVGTVVIGSGSGDRVSEKAVEVLFGHAKLGGKTGWGAVGRWSMIYGQNAEGVMCMR